MGLLSGQKCGGEPLKTCLGTKHEDRKVLAREPLKGLSQATEYTQSRGTKAKRQVRLSVLRKVSIGCELGGHVQKKGLATN